MESALDEYRKQIELWQENICKITFGKSGNEKPGRTDDEARKR